jgi:hypothetical protein
LPERRRAGPLLNTMVHGLDYGSGSELGRSLGALGRARVSTRKTNTVQGTRRGTRVRNKKMPVPIQPT